MSVGANPIPVPTVVFLVVRFQGQCQSQYHAMPIPKYQNIPMCQVMQCHGVPTLAAQLDTLYSRVYENTPLLYYCIRSSCHGAVYNAILQYIQIVCPSESPSTCVCMLCIQYCNIAILRDIACNSGCHAFCAHFRWLLPRPRQQLSKILNLGCISSVQGILLTLGSCYYIIGHFNC